MAIQLSELAALVGGEISGNPSLQISGVNGLAEAGPSDLSFYGNTRYRKDFERTKAAAVLVSEAGLKRDGVTLVRVQNPHLAFARILGKFTQAPRPPPGVHPRAFVHPEASVDPTAAVMANATVDRGAKVGAGAVLYPGVYVGEEAQIGEGSVLHANVTVRERCIVGARVILHASAVIGADGFGFAFNPEVPEHFKIPQTGIVRIEDDVEVGACTCIDRATIGETVIGRGTKIDNLVQLAHNVRVGQLSLICAQAGVSGSAEIGNGVILAGQVGVIGHIRVGDMAKVGAQSGISGDVEDGAIMSGSPAIPHREWLKNSAAAKDLAGLVKEVRALRRRVEELEGKGKST